MKRKLLSAAVASAVATGPALAFDPTVTAPEYVITWSGATAPTDTLADVLAFEICDTDIDIFRHPNHYSIACTVRNNANRIGGAAPVGVSIAGLPAGGRKVLFHKNDGGSGTGAGAVQKAISDGATVTISGPTARAACTSTPVALPKAHTRNTGCPLNEIPMQSDMGISDVEPTIFIGDLAPPVSEGGPYEPNGALLRVKNVSGLGFGVNVTLAMYRALQNVQFPLGDACNPEPAAPADDTMSAVALTVDPSGLVAGADGYNDAYQVLASDAGAPPTPKVGGPHRKGDTRACMPNLSRHEVNQILVGNVPTLLELVDSSTGQDLFTSQSGKPWGPADPLLNICRRRTGSGTHAQTSIFFLRTQCGGSDSQVMVDAPLLAGQLYVNVGSGNMDRCLDALDTGAPYALSTPPVAAGPANRYALGYQSVEKNSDFSGSYRFVKVDGRATTLVEMHAGNALNFGEVTTQIRDAENYVDPDIATNGETGSVTDIWESVAARLTDPAGVTTLNALGKFRHPWGDAGFLIDPDPFGANGPARTPDATFSAANPVGTFVHGYPGFTQNSCLSPQKGAIGVTPIPVDL